jgi:hypothetical protein
MLICCPVADVIPYSFPSLNHFWRKATLPHEPSGLLRVRVFGYP